MNFTYDNFNPYIIPIDAIPTGTTHLSFSHLFNEPLPPDCIPDSVTHLVFGIYFNQPLTHDCIPSSVKYLYFFMNFDYKLSTEEIIMNPEIEINFHANNKSYPKNRIVHLFYWYHNQNIPRDNMDFEETIIDCEWNDYIMDTTITKIRLTPKFLLQSCVKSASKI